MMGRRFLGGSGGRAAVIGPAIALALAALAVLLPAAVARAQTNPAFNVNLSIDYSSAEETLELLRGGYASTQQLSRLRGNRIAASTSELIAGRADAPALLRAYLDSLQAHQIIRDDIYRLEEARRNADTIAALLDELQRRNFNRRVVATVEQLFPGDSPVSAVIPVYVVAFGHENADAYVRRITWKGDTPEFVGEGEGELTIIINLAAAGVKLREHNLVGVERHARRALELFEEVQRRVSSEEASWASRSLIQWMRIAEQLIDVPPPLPDDRTGRPVEVLPRLHLPSE